MGSGVKKENEERENNNNKMKEDWVELWSVCCGGGKNMEKKMEKEKIWGQRVWELGEEKKERKKKETGELTTYVWELGAGRRMKGNE